MIRRRAVAELILALLFFCTAPTAGDIGGCGQRADNLDPEKFFSAKQSLDCERCTACQLTTKVCSRACQPGLVEGDFPKQCEPLVHDGEVCLHALQAASCSTYASYVADEGATTPTECNFCPASGP